MRALTSPRLSGVANSCIHHSTQSSHGEKTRSYWVCTRNITLWTTDQAHDIPTRPRPDSTIRETRRARAWIAAYFGVSVSSSQPSWSEFDRTNANGQIHPTHACISELYTSVRIQVYAYYWITFLISAPQRFSLGTLECLST
jgi:hypothetical protein